MATIASTLEIIEEIRAGRMVILTDAEDRENEGDLLIGAQFVTPEIINFMVTHARGLVCLTVTNEIVDRLNLPLMTQVNGSHFGTNFTVSIEAVEGVTTGISAYDRAATIQAAISPNAKPSDIAQPGHIFPVRAEEGGVLVRAGHTEAGCDLTRMAGLIPAATICEVLKEDGTMAHLPDLLTFAEKHQIKVGTIADLIAYRLATESLVEQIDESIINTSWGEFKQVIFADRLSGETHIALVKGNPSPEQEILVRVHEPFSAADLLTADSSHSWSLPNALSHINEKGCGIAILMHRTETGDDMRAKLINNKKPALPVKWDSKTYGIGAQILSQLNVSKMRIMAKRSTLSSLMGLTGFGLEILGFEEKPE